MKIEKFLLYYDAFPVDLLTDTRPEFELKNYEKRTGEKLTDQSDLMQKSAGFLRI